MDRKTLNIIVEHKIEKVCKLYFEIQEEYKEDFEKINLFDSDLERMTQYATGEYDIDKIDTFDMNVMNRIWKTYNKYKKEGKVYDEWDDIDELLREGKKINAIKLYRKINNTDLRESKDAIDDRYEKLGY